MVGNGDQFSMEIMVENMCCGIVLGICQGVVLQCIVDMDVVVGDYFCVGVYCGYYGQVVVFGIQLLV